ncbi:hypothetical protein Tco_0671806, partial [Tanacetum coccineum]
REFLRQKGSRGVRGVKEKDKVVNAKRSVSPAVTDEPVVMEKLTTSVDTSIPNGENTGLSSYPPLPTQGSTPAGNTYGMSSCANVTCVPSRKALNFRTLFTPGGNRVDVVVPVESIRAVSERFANTAYGFFLGKRVAYPVVVNYVRNTWGKYGLVNLLKEDVGNVSVWVKLHGVPVTAFSNDGLSVIATKIGTPSMLDSYTSDMCLQSWGRSSYARAMIELKVDAEFKDSIVVVMPKLTGEGFYTCTVRVEYEWKLPRLRCGKEHEETSQAPKDFLVGSKIGFKQVKEYRPVFKRPTVNASGNKKNDVEPTNKVSNSNPFDVLNSVKNDMDLGTNVKTLNSASKEPNSSGSSFWNVESSSMSHPQTGPSRKHVSGGVTS